MFEPSQYELLDFGGGRKLERFGDEVLDRPSPSAETVEVRDPGRWALATARYDAGRGGTGEWRRRSPAASAPEVASVRHGEVRLLVELAASGNVGLFPEHALHWDWIGERITSCRADRPDVTPRVLNLFGYSGGASLLAAAFGAEVTHVDASGPAVALAKRNAEASSLAGAPVRWLVEDALKFVGRAGRRGDHYDGIIVDPPTYGHGPKGRPFKFRRHLDELMAGVGGLLADGAAGHRFLLFSAHAPGFGADDAAATVAAAVPGANRPSGRAVHLRTTDGRRLPAGVAVRWRDP